MILREQKQPLKVNAPKLIHKYPKTAALPNEKLIFPKNSQRITPSSEMEFLLWRDLPPYFRQVQFQYFIKLPLSLTIAYNS